MKKEITENNICVPMPLKIHSKTIVVVINRINSDKRGLFFRPSYWGLSPR